MNEKYSPVQLDFSSYFGIIISGEEYDLCYETSKNWWSNSKKGNYGKGILNTEEDPFKTTRVGLLGEMAFGKGFGLSVDFVYKKFGGKTDFIIGKKTIDVKTQANHSKIMRILYKNEKGNIIRLKSDLYVAASLKSENIKQKTAEIVFKGFVRKEDLTERYIKQSPVFGCEHYNYDIPYEKLHSFKHIINSFEKLKDKANV